MARYDYTCQHFAELVGGNSVAEPRIKDGTLPTSANGPLYLITNTHERCDKCADD